MSSQENSEKHTRLQFKTYLQVIRNSVGTSMFRNWYVKTAEQGEFDAMKDGENSCAFYASAVLVIFKKINAIHGTVISVVKDLEESGWQAVNKPQPGDVLVWEAQEFGGVRQKHIGFYVGDNRAVGTSWTEKVVVEHELNFDKHNRKIEQNFRISNWDENNSSKVD